jgi:hypothetical protein
MTQTRGAKPRLKVVRDARLNVRVRRKIIENEAKGKISVFEELRYERGNSQPARISRGMLVSIPPLNTSSSSSSLLMVFFDVIACQWAGSKRTLNPHLGLEFATHGSRGGIGLVSDDGRVLLAEAGEMRGSDTV